jgi:hypothetical protein
VVDRVRLQGGTPPGQVFKTAQRLVQWHYQWIVVHQFLPQILGQTTLDAIFQGGRQFYKPKKKAFIPVEFQGACYRFGHSQVRPGYRANRTGNNGAPFAGGIFNPAGQGQADPVDLRGGARAPRRFIGWEGFFDFGDGLVQRNKRIDTHLSSPLFNLPLGTIGDGQPPTSLATRNLLRQVTWSLPSGQAIAQAMGVPALSAADLSELAVYGLGLDTSTPLWYYTLKEADVQNQGLRLGAVGGRIVGEVFVGLLQLDSDSYLNAPAPWTPTLPTRTGVVTGDFAMQDLLTFAGVDPTSRGH